MDNSLAFALILSVFACATIVPQVEARAFFVFGDSLVDSGNNDYLATTARADSPPYGIDYPTRRPTGRFSNGFNIPDLISEAIGMESTLPYLSPQLRGEKLLVGANFASAGIGILNDTGIQFFIEIGTLVLPTVFARRCLCYLMNDKPQEALGDAMQAQVASPEWGTAFYLQAAALYSLGMDKDARETLKDGSSLDAKRKRN